MGWLFEFVAQIIAEAVGGAVARNRPWWVELVAMLGCLAAVGIVSFACWFLLVVIRP